LIRREIEGLYYYCHDVQENELERAKENRKLVGEKLSSEFWSQMERYLEDHPRAKLPEWIPSNKE
jgi:hypothetical protein